MVILGDRKVKFCLLDCLCFVIFYKCKCAASKIIKGLLKIQEKVATKWEVPKISSHYTVCVCVCVCVFSGNASSR